MKHFPVVQGKTDWSEMRRGIPTASQFSRIITPSGAKSGQWEAYKFELLAERMGAEIQGFKSWAMERGSQLEARAVAHFEFVTGLSTEPCGFISNDAVTWGGSPDRFVESEDLLECKCPEMDEHLQLLMGDGSAWKKYKVQCQGELYVCEKSRKSVYLLSHYPKLPWAMQRIERDEPFLEKMDKYVREFSNDLEQLCEQAREKGWIKESGSAQSSAGHDKGAPRTPNLIDILKESLIAVGKQKETA